MGKRVSTVKLSKETISWQQALESFMYLKKAEGRSENTLKDYYRHVERFFRRYPSVFTDFNMLEKNALEYMGQEGISAAYYNQRLINFKAFLKWCVEESIIPKNPLEKLKVKKSNGRQVNFDTELLPKLLSLPDQKSFAGLRDYALLLLSLDTGIRPKEAFDLKISDITNTHEVFIRAETAKTRTPRTLPISLPTENAIRKLIRSRPSYWDNDVPVFCSNEGSRFTLSGWRSRLIKYGELLGAKVRPYDTRHLFAIEYLRNEGNAFTLQRTLGHVDLTMTKRYLALTGNDLKEQHRKASPVEKLLSKKTRVRKIN